MKNCIKYIVFGSLTLFAVSCSQDQDTGNPMSESQLINEIKFNTGNVIELAVGMSQNIVATYSTENVDYPSLVWTSSNPDIATSDNDGNIAGVSVGNTIVSISQYGNLVSLANLAVQVKPVATAITLDEVSVYEGSKVKLSASLTPVDSYSKLSWSVADESVAKIDGDSLIALVPGETTVMASTIDGSNLSATAKLTVKDFVPITDFNLIGFGYDLNIGDKGKIDCALVPEDATADLLTWTSNDESIATVDGNGVVTGVGYGKAVITASSSTGISKTMDVTVGEGTINQNFADGIGKWYIDQSGASYTLDGTCITVQMQSGSKWRGDLAIASNNNPLTINAGVYRYFAIKMTRPGKYAAGSNSNGTIFLDTNHGRYMQSTGNGNSMYSILNYEGNESAAPMDQPQVLYYDMQQPFGNNNYYWPINAVESSVTTFKLGIADVPSTYSGTYNVYWVHCFKTLDELKAFAANN